MKFEIKQDSNRLFSLRVNGELIGDTFEDGEIVANRIKIFIKARYP